MEGEDLHADIAALHRECQQHIAEIERLRADVAFLTELSDMAADLRFSSEFIGITVRNRLVRFKDEQSPKLTEPDENGRQYEEDMRPSDDAEFGCKP